MLSIVFLPPPASTAPLTPPPCSHCHPLLLSPTLCLTPQSVPRALSSQCPQSAPGEGTSLSALPHPSVPSVGILRSVLTLLPAPLKTADGTTPCP